MDRGHGGLCSGTNAVAAWKKLTGNSHQQPVLAKPSPSETKEAQDKVRRTVIGFTGVELTFDESDIVFSKIPLEKDGSGTCV